MTEQKLCADCGHEKEKIDFTNGHYGWNWDEDGCLGNFWLECPCGAIIKKSSINIREIITCLCGKQFWIERTTKAFYKNSMEMIQNEM